MPAPSPTVRRRRGVVAALTLLVVWLFAAPPAAAWAPALASPAAGSPTTPEPGMAPQPGCAARVSFSSGAQPVTRPLPGPASQVGGAVLAAPGLHVTGTARTPPPQPRASAWLVADLVSGQVLAACNAHQPLAPASSLKVLTALALMPAIAGNARYVARAEDARVDGTRVGLVPGSVYTASDLWAGLLLNSGNDAATALASLAGGTATAAQLMQRTAAALGAADTVVLNTSGLDEAGQRSSAYDLALFGRAALANPAIARLVGTRSYRFPRVGTTFGGSRATYEIQNHNRLLYNYPGAVGVKNGWTSTAGGSFVGAARRGTHAYLVTLLAGDPPTWHMAASLLDWAFATTPTGGDVGHLVTGPDQPPGTPAAGTPPAGARSGLAAAKAAADTRPARPSDQADLWGAGGAALVGLLLLVSALWWVRYRRHLH